MVKPNYQFEKRQRELAKKKKKEEKVQRKAASQQPAVPDDADKASDSQPSPQQP